MSSPRRLATRVIAQTPRTKRVLLPLPKPAPCPSIDKPSAETALQAENEDSNFVDDDSDEDKHNSGKDKDVPVTDADPLIRPSKNTTRMKRMYYFKHGNHIDEKVWSKKKHKWEYIEKWQCIMCPEERFSLGTTSNVIRHLDIVHQIYHPNKKRKPIPHSSRVDDSEPSASGINNAIKVDAAYVKQCLVAHFAADHVPFSRIESPSFRNLLKAVCPDAESIIPKSGDTLRKYVMDVFKEKKTELGEAFSTMAYPPHIGFDGWTSDSCHGMQGIVAYFLSPDQSTCMTALLGLKEVDGKHTGLNIAKCISKALEEYNLKPGRIGYYMLDNAPNNDTAVDSLEGTECGKCKRLRCICHAMSLCCKALFSTSKSDDDNESTGKWKRHQAINKVQSIAKRILNNPNWKSRYRVEFTSMIKMENSTRWGSVYDMISSVLGKELQLNRFVEMMIKETTDTAQKQKLEKLILTIDDFQILQEINEILKPFKELMTVLQGCLY